MGIRVTLGDDSHGVASVGVGLSACLDAIRAAGIESVSYLTARTARCDGRGSGEDVAPR